MSADFAHPDLNLLADDVIAAALPFLPAGADNSILGVELDRRPTLALLVPVESLPRAPSPASSPPATMPIWSTPPRRWRSNG